MAEEVIERGRGPASSFLFSGNSPNISFHSPNSDPRGWSNIVVLSLELPMY